MYADDLATKQTTTLKYDALGRESSRTDPRGLESKRDYYYGTSQVQKTYGRNTSNSAFDTLSKVTYDPAGRVASSTNPVNAATSYTYYSTGKVKDETGTGTHPVHHEYNTHGEQTELWTYRTATTPDKTTWDYDEETGLLKSKKDAVGRTITYNYWYDPDYNYRMTSRKSSRGITTTWMYRLDTGDLRRIEYDDSTSAVDFLVYTRTGKPDTVNDATGCRDLLYDHEQFSAEYLSDSWYHGLVLTQLYDDAQTANKTLNLVPGRYAGVELGTASELAREYKNGVTYDDFGRVNGVVTSYAGQSGRSPLAVTGNYTYQPNTSFWKDFTEGSFKQSRVLEAGRDVISSTSSTWNTTIVTSQSYITNEAFQRRKVLQQGTAYSAGYGEDTYVKYTYNDAGELLAGEGFFGSVVTDESRPMAGRGHHFTYDQAGNRKTAMLDSDPEISYTDGAGQEGGNSLNQIITHGTLKTHVSGTANPAASVAIDGVTIARDGTAHYWDAVLESMQEYRQLNIGATLGADSRAQQIWALFRPSSETLAYDEDGNLTQDGVWKYTWDAENRLTAISNVPARTWNRAMPTQSISFTYDYLGRRAGKVSVTGDVTTERRYVYHGWNLIAELDPVGVVKRSYAWGLDLQGSLTASGGIGALVLETIHTANALTAYHVATDANGNVTALVTETADTQPSLAAVYEYEAFGQLLRKTGPEATNNPFRFSTKFTDQETGLIYYGHRYYDPNLGRFINRDRIGEAGGYNLYGFVGNSPIDHWDYLGQWDLLGQLKTLFPHARDENDQSGSEPDKLRKGDESLGAEKAQQQQTDSESERKNIGELVSGMLVRGDDAIGLKDSFASGINKASAVLDLYAKGMSMVTKATPFLGISLSLTQLVSGRDIVGQKASRGEAAVELALSGLIMSGHGWMDASKFRLGGETVAWPVARLPKGTSLTQWVGHGETMPPEMGKLIDLGKIPDIKKFPEMEGAKTWIRGGYVPDYSIAPPDYGRVMGVYGSALKIPKVMKLSEFLKEDMGVVELSTCLSEKLF